MKILWIAPFLPYDNVGHAGGKLLNYYINSLVDNDNFDVRYIGFSKPSEYEHFTLDKKIDCYISIYHDHGIKKVLRNCYDLYSLKCPFDKNGNITTSYLKRCILKRLEILKKEGYVPDVIILHWTQTIVFVKDVKKIYDTSKIVGIEEDVSVQACLRKYENAKNAIHKIITRIRYDNIRKSERNALSVCDLIILNNEKDLAILEKLNVNRPINIWSTYYDRFKIDRVTAQKTDILFYGDMSRPENYIPAIWLVDEVFPLIKDLGLNLVILGGHPPKELLEKATDRVVITGFVEDISSYLASSLCLVAPLVLGAGIKVKVLTCMAAGIPVCTNDVGIEGIPAIKGKDYFYCKDKTEYADAVKQLFINPQKAQNMAESAQNLIEQKFNYKRSSRDFERWLTELAR